MTDLDFKVPIINTSRPSFCTQDFFADWTGLTPDTVRGMLQVGTLPSLKIGRRTVVNIDQIQEDIRKGKSIFSNGDYSD